MAVVYGNLGNVYQQQANFEWAIQAYKNAIDRNIKIGQEDSSGKHYANLGSVYGRQGHYDLALEMMQKRYHVNNSRD